MVVPGSAGRPQLAVAEPMSLSAQGIPRVDDSDTQILEVLDVPCGERGSSRKRDACDLRIAHVNGPTGLLARCRQIRSLDRGGTVEIEDAILQIFLDEPIKRRLEQSLSLPLGQQRKSQTRFKKRDAGYPDRFGWLIIEPSHDLNLRLGTHER